MRVSIEYVREEINSQNITLSYVSSKTNQADILTTILFGNAFLCARDMLGLLSTEEVKEKGSDC
jgi:hypothetical protein